MAAGQITVLDVALEKLTDGTFDLDNDAFNVVLLTDDQALTAAFVGTSGNAQYSDLTNETTGPGYTAEGEPLAGVQWTRAGSVVSLTATATAWTALTAGMKYAVIIKNEAGTLTHILAYVDLETGDPAGRSSSGGDFVINWTGGLFTLTRAA